MGQNSSDSTSSQSSWLIPASIIAAGAIIALAVIYSGSPLPRAIPPGGGQSGGSNQAAGFANAVNLADDDPALGDPNAPVTVVEFSDFQCPFCRRFFETVLPRIKDEYVKTGKARFVYRDFPISSIHDMAQKYAEAAECADEAGKFWAMHDKIFNEQSKKGSGTVLGYTVDDVKRWAAELGLDTAQFGQCLDSGKYASEVEKDLQDGQAVGVAGTPGTFVNSQFISGAVPYEEFRAAIDAELAKKSSGK
ncbi:MAG: DsbA family protein [Candidatus Sungbacteria bacterium]|nr:DsbA family protein [Candidatus Sungbacteria bacterium]